MEKRKLAEFVNFIPGINQSRAEKQFGISGISYYDQASFDEDYQHRDNLRSDIGKASSFASDVTLDKNDVVISNSLQRATMIGQRNIGKVLSLNFTKVEFQNDGLDKNYFLYLFNDYKEVQRQKERELQGTGFIQKLTKQSLEQLIIPYAPLVDQQKIGSIYRESLKLQSKLDEYSKLIGEFTDSILEGSLEAWNDER